MTEAEHKAIAELVEKDPALGAKVAALTAKLEADYAAVPTIKVEVQPLDEKGNPVGASYTVASKDGVIDTAYTALTSQELLLMVQAEKEHRPERGFAIGSHWQTWAFGSGRPWPNGTVKFFFSGLDDEDEDWMRKAMDRMEAGTGMRFTEVANNLWNQFRWLTFVADYAKIGKKRLRGAGEATVGKRWQSYLTLDLRYVQDERTVNHEMGHLFGLLHEHQRYDRGDHVLVGTRGSDFDKLSRLRRSCFLGLFRCQTVTNTTVYGTQYDYNSVMHYYSCDLPELRITLKNGKYWLVHEANNDRWGDENGNTYFTPWDIYTIKKLYGISPNRRPSYTPTPGTTYTTPGDCP